MAENTLVSVNDTVYKVGRTSGWDSGTVTDTCTGSNLGNGRWLLCQNIASGAVDPGDSGSPVFKITNSPNQGDVELLGILWGGVDSFHFSPIGAVYLDLGMSVTWDACDPSFDC